MGSNAIVGQSGGPTAVINASLAGVFSACREHGISRIYGMCNGVQGLLQERLIDLAQAFVTPEDIELLIRTPSSYLGSCRYKLPDAGKDEAVYEQLFAILERYDIGYFFYIGGNDSMDTILKLSDYAQKKGSDIRFIGVPKTIDNDLAVTDHTPGYGSAAKYIAATLKELVRDSTIYDLRSVTIVEIMGRNAGWLTAAAALAEDEDCEGVAMICLPEVVFDPERFVREVERLQQHTPSLVIAVSEGIRVADGRYVCELSEDALHVDSFGHKYLGGTARYLCTLLGERINTKTRAVELSTLQRCAAHIASGTDIDEAFAAGSAAVGAALEGKTGMMVAFVRAPGEGYRCETALHDIHGIANAEKTVPLEWIDAEHYRMREPFMAYVRPLIDKELFPIFRHGVPRHLRRKAQA